MYFGYMNATVISLCNDEIIQCCFCTASLHSGGFEKMERAKHRGKRWETGEWEGQQTLQQNPGKKNPQHMDH